MALFENPYPPVTNVQGISTVDIPDRGALDVANPTVDNFQPIQLFAPSTMDLSAFMPSDLRNNEMQTQRPLTIDPRYDAPAPASSSVVAGMFPEVEAMQRALYQQKQNEAMQAQAYQFAQLSPMQQAQYSLYMGGQQLGGAIGSALGGKDPQLQLISMRNAISRQIDMRSPESYYKAATLANQAGDREFATSLVDVGRKLELDTSLIQQRTREKQAADPFEQLLRAGKFTAASLAKYQISKNVADLKEVEKPEKERNIAFGTEAERKSKTMYGRPYADLTPEESGKVDAAVEVSEQAKAKASAIVLPGEKIEPKDYLRFNEYIDKTPTMTRTSSILSDAPTAIETIRMSTKNNFSSASLPAAIAKITGEGKSMSNQDIERYTRTGGLDERIAGDVVGFFTGKKTDITKAQAEQYAISLYRGALIERKKFIQDQAEQLGYDKSPNYETTIKQLDKKLEQFKLIKPSNQTRASSPNATTEVDAEKEKRYQQYKQNQLGANK